MYILFRMTTMETRMELFESFLETPVLLSLFVCVLEVINHNKYPFRKQLTTLRLARKPPSPLSGVLAL